MENNENLNDDSNGKSGKPQKLNHSTINITYLNICSLKNCVNTKSRLDGKRLSRIALHSIIGLAYLTIEPVHGAKHIFKAVQMSLPSGRLSSIAGLVIYGLEMCSWFDKLGLIDEDTLVNFIVEMIWGGS